MIHLLPMPKRSRPQRLLPEPVSMKSTALISVVGAILIYIIVEYLV